MVALGSPELLHLVRKVLLFLQHYWGAVASQWRARRIINLHLVRKVLLFAVYAAHAMQVRDITECMSWSDWDADTFLLDPVESLWGLNDAPCLPFTSHGASIPSRFDWYT
jgi:hypothetical protein